MGLVFVIVRVIVSFYVALNFSSGICTTEK